MSRAANLKRDGKESVWMKRRREREEFDEMQRRHEEEITKEVEKKFEAEEAKKADDSADETVKEVAKEATKDQKTDREKLNAIKRPPTNKELAEQIKHNTGLIGRLTDQIGDLTGGVEKIVDLVGQHDQVLGDHGRRISALEKATGILDPKPEPAARATSPDTETGAKAEPVKSEPVKTEKTVQKAGDYYGYLYFPVDKYTGKIRWDLPFHSSVDAADCKISCSWRRRLFFFNAEGKVLREATPEESSKFSCA